MMSHTIKNEVWYTWLIVLMFSALIWIINAGIDISEAMISGGRVQYGVILVHELTAALMVPLLFPVLLWGFITYPIERPRRLRRLSFHLSMAVLYGVCHTSLMIAIRYLIYFLLGWPAYDPGILSYRYLMEFQKQFPLYWFIYGIFFLFQYIRTNQDRRIQTSLLEKQLTQARLQALKMQLNPHFLFNTLNMISSFMYENIEKADQMIVDLSDLLRLTLNTRDRQMMTLAHEIKILNLYLTIMKARFDGRLHTTMEIDESTESALFPVLMLQPLVENSIKHSSDRADHITEILIRSRKISDRLEVIVQDNGPGVAGEPDLQNKEGVGLQITRDRLSQLYGSGHAFTISNHPDGGLTVRILIPFKEALEEQ